MENVAGMTKQWHTFSVSPSPLFLSHLHIICAQMRTLIQDSSEALEHLALLVKRFSTWGTQTVVNAPLKRTFRRARQRKIILHTQNIPHKWICLFIFIFLMITSGLLLFISLLYVFAKLFLEVGCCPLVTKFMVNGIHKAIKNTIQKQFCAWGFYLHVICFWPCLNQCFHASHS